MLKHNLNQLSGANAHELLTKGYNLQQNTTAQLIYYKRKDVRWFQNIKGCFWNLWIVFFVILKPHGSRRGENGWVRGCYAERTEFKSRILKKKEKNATAISREQSETTENISVQ